MRRFIFKTVIRVWVFLPVAVWAGEELPEIRQVSTHPSLDLSPAVSPDGQWLAFVSERSGNLDIWLKQLPRGRAVQITTHQAEDLQPAWSPDGERLAFVSKRRDAQGDIWTVSLNFKKGGKPTKPPDQLTRNLGADTNPSFTADGRYVVFASDRDGMMNLWWVEIQNKKFRQLTFRGGSDPACSPVSDWLIFTSMRSHPEGDLFLMDLRAEAERPQMEAPPIIYSVTFGSSLDGQAAWSPDGTAIVFQRLTDDTDGNGRVDPEDRGSLWVKVLAAGGAIVPERIQAGLEEIQISSQTYQDAEPDWGSDGAVYFTSSRGGGMDIWSMPPHGITPRMVSAQEQYMAVMERFGGVVTVEGLEQGLLAYRTVMEYFPKDTLWVARSLIQMGEVYRVLGDTRQARQTFLEVIRKYPTQTTEVARAELRLATLGEEPLEVRMALCRDIIETFTETLSIVAEAWLVLGDIYQESGDRAQALAAYGRVLEYAPGVPNFRAQARLKIGDLLGQTGQHETARSSYLLVLREFRDVPLWRARAGDRLLGQVAGSTQEQIRGYQNIIQEAADLPSLVAKAQLSIGRILIDGEFFDQSLRELERVPVMVPGLDWAHAEADLLRARAYDRMGDKLKAKNLLRDVREAYASLEGGRYAAEAEDLLFTLLFNSAEERRQYGELAAAETQYREALAIRPDDIRIHRGLIEVVHRQGRILTLIEDYKTALSENPKDPILLYSLGLVYSYFGERDKDILQLSNDYLHQALSEDYRLIYPYRTLGYNYEAMERLAEEKARRKPSLVVRVGKTIVSPVRWLVGLLPIGRKQSREQYYESAIEVSLTALELNDERQDPEMEAYLTQNLANNFYAMGEFAFKKAYEYYGIRLSLDSTFNSPGAEAEFYERAGRCGFVLEDPLTAIRYVKKAIQINMELGKDRDVLRNRRRLAFLYHLDGLYEEAIAVYGEAVAQGIRLGEWAGVEQDYRNIAYNYFLMEEPVDALEYAEKAEGILLRSPIPMKPPKRSKLRVEIFGFSIPVWGMEEIGGASAEGFTPADEAALVYSLMSRSHEKLKRFDKAIEFEKKRLEIFRKRKDRLAERISLNRLGLLHMADYQYAEAWGSFYLSWQENKKRKDDHGRWVCAVNLGHAAAATLTIEEDDSRLADAIRILETESKRLEKREENPYFRERVLLFNRLGALIMLGSQYRLREFQDMQQAVDRTLEAMEDLETAESYLKTGLDLAREGRLLREQGIILKNLAEITDLIGPDSAAYAHLEASLRVLEEAGAEALIWRVLYGMANLTRRRSDSGLLEEARDSLALRLYTEAMDRLERLPVEEAESEIRLSDREDRWSLYVDAAIAFSEAGRIEEALEAVERGRERWVADVISRRPPRLKRERHWALWRDMKYIQSRLREIRGAIAEARVSKSAERPIDVGEFQTDLARYEREYDEAVQRLREEDPVLAYISGIEPAGLGPVQAALTEHTGILSYLVGADRIIIWAVDRDTVLMEMVEAEKPAVIQKVETLVHQIAADSIDSGLCRDLFDLFIGPVDAFVDEKRDLLIVPDRTTWNMPFGILSDNGRPLQDRAALIYSPSLAAYRLAWERKRVNSQDVLLIGTPRTGDYAALLEDHFRTVKTLVGPTATETRFKRDARTFDILHLDGSIIPGIGNPLMSKIGLLPEESDDGMFHAFEVYSEEFSASLCVLPPLRHSRASLYETSVIFLYGLIYSGVPTMIIPSSTVSGAVMRDFVEMFYSGLSRNRASDALSATQRYLNDTYGSPKTWTGFRIVGFGGMDAGERKRFAFENLGNTVRKGRSFENRGDYSDAVREFEKAKDMAEAMGDSTLVLRVHDEIRRVSAKGGNWERAVASLKRLRNAEEAAGDRAGVRRSLRRLVAYYMNDGRYEAAVETMMEVVHQLENDGDTGAVAQAYEQLAHILSADRHYDEAIEWADKANTLYGQIGDTHGEGRTAVIKGRFKLDSEDYTGAYADLLKGVSLLGLTADRASRKDTLLVHDLASGYQLLGLACERLTRYEEALAFQESGLTLFKDIDRQVAVAQGYQYSANLHWMMGDYRRAFSLQNRALATFDSLGDGKLLAMASGTLGLIHMSLGDLDKAREAEMNASRLAEQHGHLEDQAAYLRNLGLIDMQDGAFDNAMESYSQAMQIDSSLNIRRGLAYDYRHIGNVLILTGDYENAVSFLGRGLGVSVEIDDGRNQVHCLYGLGRAYGAMGRMETALALLDSSEMLARGLAIPDLEWRIYRQRAHFLGGAGRQEEALRDYRRAVEVVENMRAGLKVEAFMQGFLDDKMDLYFDVVHLLYKMNRIEEAYHFVERARSRNFVDLLGNRQLNLARADGEWLQKERTARQELKEAQDRLAWIQRKEGRLSALEQEQKKTWEQAVESKRASYESLLISIQAENPELASFVSVDPLRADAVQRLLPDTTAIVEYFLTDEEIFCWVLLPDRMVANTVEVASDSVVDLVRRFRETLQAHLSTDVEGSALYRLLMKPIEKDLRSVKHLIIVPHGVLHYLPFAALQTDLDAFLIDTHVISIVPSGTVLKYCMEKSRDLKAGEKHDAVLALSNPDLGDPAYDLLFAEKEVQSLRRTFGHVSAYFHGDVTEGLARREAGAYAIIHFACHGVFEPENPLFSALLLTPEAPDDGRLEAHEIFGLKLDCDLVMLSACETGLSHITRGDDVIGLVRSFIFAGTPSIITSLWKVDDLATAVMVKRFYRYLSAGYSKVMALSLAQHVVKDRVSRHPSAWAAFQLTGDFR